MERCTLPLIGGQARWAVTRMAVWSGGLAKTCLERSRSDERHHGMDVGAHGHRVLHPGGHRVRQPD